ncbi:MAG: hypothetical protein ABS46_00135 [Cytophagaceae bacterium SCN 52-12]|nr:MAG: hypothetical protein ABS46_00135 [Cytophagaceae bacterium SCN 52-12]
MFTKMRMEEFNRLLKRYLRGQVTTEEERLLEEWHKNQPEVSFPEMSGEEKGALEQKIWKSVRSGAWGGQPARRLIAIATGVAASLLLGMLWFLLPGAREEARTAAVSGQQRFEIRNTTGSDQEIMLSDSTIVLLRQDSHLVYENSFNQERREVFLHGEAFFQVKRDEMKPFIVHTGNLITEVLGTSFRVKENKNGNTTEVSVTSGKVSVYTDSPQGKSRKNGFILTANQQVSYSKATHYITAGIVEEPVAHIRDDVQLPSLDFRSVPLQEVLQALTQYYGIEFVIADPRVKECGISADLTGLSMFTQLELICKSIDATYERRGTVVFINGEGC